MYKFNLKFIYLFFYLIFQSSPSFTIFASNQTTNNFKKENDIFEQRKYQNPFLANQYLNNVLRDKLLNSENRLVNLALDTEERKKEKFSVEIISDTKYQIDTKIYAEGNVVVLLKNGELKTDKLIYDEAEEKLVLEGNISFYKGNQYLEATYFNYSFKEDKGYIENVYGVLDIVDFKKDTNFNFEESIIDKKKNFKNKQIGNIRYESSANIGFENTFEDDKNINITDINFKIPPIKKWRFKSDKIIIDKENLYSKHILFTNDPFNKPQFFLISKNFAVETVNEKIRLNSKNTWINFEGKLSFPIGRRNIIDRDPITRWGIGSEYKDKDGFYIFRSFNKRKLFGEYELEITPYFLIQRAIKGNTSSFVEKNSSILSSTVNKETSSADYFAINTNLKGKIKSWDLDINSDLYSLDLDKLANASRLKATLTKSFDLTSNEIDDEEKNDFSNNLDLQFYGGYRQTVVRSFSGDQEMYLGKGFRVSNQKTWQKKDIKNTFSIDYDIGEFESKEKKANKLKTSTRNVLTASIINEIPIWQKKNLDDEIDISYKYSPEVIKQGLKWVSSIKSGVYFYGDGSNQKAISFTSGPNIILGSYKNDFLDYTKLNISANFILKDGESPFAFDDIDKTQKLNLYLEQQLIGPLLFSYEGFVNLDNNSDNYATFTQATYALNINRRAYSIGAFYKESSEAFGIQFNINNFDFSGLSEKF